VPLTLGLTLTWVLTFPLFLWVLLGSEGKNPGDATDPEHGARGLSPSLPSGLMGPSVKSTRIPVNARVVLGRAGDPGHAGERGTATSTS